MINLIHLIFLAITQGITEFLPISSSGHLVLYHHIFNIKDQGILIDAAIHFGTLFAVVIYFYKDIIYLVKKFFNPKKDYTAYKILLASLPIFFAGCFVLYFQPQFLRNKFLIIFSTFIFAILLYFADKKERKKQITNITFKQAFIIGCGQVLSLIPGVSRSGITITFARFFKLDRIQAVKFSLFLSVPTIFAAGVASYAKIIFTQKETFTATALIASAFSFIASFITLFIFLRLIDKKDMSFTPFVIYRIILALVIFLI